MRKAIPGFLVKVPFYILQLAILAMLSIPMGCEKEEVEVAPLELQRMAMGETILDLGSTNEGMPIDQNISLQFSQALEPGSASNAIQLNSGEGELPITVTVATDPKRLTVRPTGALKTNTEYMLVVSELLRGANGSVFQGTEITFKTIVGSLQLTALEIEGAGETRTGRMVDVPVEGHIQLTFSAPVDRASLQEAVQLNGPGVPTLQFSFSENDQKVTLTGDAPLEYISKYTFELSQGLVGADGQGFGGFSKVFYTQIDETLKFPLISDEELLTKVQAQTFKYFWDFAHENSGLARERDTSGDLVTIGGSGFGVMAILVGMERGFITRQQGVERIEKMVVFLEMADRFHGAWPHWLNGNTGETIPFSALDNGGDLVETAFMVQGLLAARAYLDALVPEEAAIREKITQLWHGVEWDWYTRGGQNVLYWHWSPDFGWDMALPIRGWNESLIVYVLAAASPTHPIATEVYRQGWARNGGMANGAPFYGVTLPLGEDLGGPLFFAHYSFLGLDPRQLNDQYAQYFEQNANHSLINQAHCVSNPLGFVGYSEDCWGLTASDNPEGYSAHSPTNDNGTITPTAAISSMPFVPEASLGALRHFYYLLGDKLWGEYGFYDAFNLTESWFAPSYLAIDQGPIILMIENHRSGLLWDLFMSDTEVQNGLDNLDFNY